jgi:adenosylhomocysteine nucleosidase
MKTIAVLAPMQEELDAVLSVLPPDPHTEDLHGIIVHHSDFAGHRILVAQSGIGKVNTALHTTLLIDHYKPDLLVNIGSAGGLVAGPKILDLVIPDKVIAWDIDASPLGVVFGQIPGEPAFFSPDPELGAKLRQVRFEGMPTVHTGTSASGDQFIYRDDQVKLINERFGQDQILCAEMEGAALARVCHYFEVPFVIVRSLSDVPAKGEGNEVDFNTFLQSAAQNAARLLKGFLEDL